MNLKEAANAYVAPTTKNISDLNTVAVNVDIKTKHVTKDNGETFSYDYITVEGQDYRVPTSVISQLKDHLESNPRLKFFSVKRSGTGMSTKYTVIPQL